MARSEPGSLTASSLFSSILSGAAILFLTILSPAGGPLARTGPGSDRAPEERGRPVGDDATSAGYDKTPAGLSESAPSLEDALGAVRRLRTRLVYDLDGERVNSELEGTGFIFEAGGRRCVVSLAHVVSEDAGEAAATRGAAAWRARGRFVSARTVIDLPAGEVELEPLEVDAATDLAFFRLPDAAQAPALPFPAGDSDRLHVGDFVYLLGRLEGTDLHVRSGIVSALAPTARVAALPWARDVFMISTPLSPGDSGSPVLAVRAGRYELVGIAQGKYETAREAGWALRINPVLAALRAALAARGAPFASSSR